MGSVGAAAVGSDSKFPKFEAAIIIDTTPNEFKPLLAELKRIREYLGELLRKWNEQATAIDAAQECAKDNRNIQPAWLDPILAKYKQPETERKAEAKEQSGIQNSARWANWCTFVATFLAFIAAAIYADIARRQLSTFNQQLVTMNNTYTQYEQQTELLRQQLVNHDNASVEMDTPYLGKNSLGGVTNLQISFSNVGKIRTRDLSIHFVIMRLSLPKQNSFSPRVQWNDGPLSIEPMSPDLPGNGRLSRTIPYLLTKAEVDPIWATTETIKITGQFTYHDGYGNLIITPVCYLFLSTTIKGNESDGFQTCGGFPSAYEDWREREQGKQ